MVKYNTIQYNKYNKQIITAGIRCRKNMLLSISCRPTCLFIWWPLSVCLSFVSSGPFLAGLTVAALLTIAFLLVASCYCCPCCVIYKRRKSRLQGHSFFNHSFIQSFIFGQLFIHSLIQSASELYSVNYSFIRTASSHSFTHSASKPVSRIGSIINSFIQPASRSVILGQLESVIKPVRCAVSSSFSALIITSILVC